MESMLASEAEHQLADAIDTNEIAKRQFIRDPHLTKKSDQTGAWGAKRSKLDQEVVEGRRRRETTAGIKHSLLRVVDLPARRDETRGAGRSRVSEAALRRDGINTDHSRSGRGAGP